MTDYDAPRHPVPADQDDDTVTELKTRRTERRSGAGDIGEAAVTASNYLSGLDVVGGDVEEFDVTIHPRQDDEFTCARCFLVQHRNRLAVSRRREQICRDCA